MAVFRTGKGTPAIGRWTSVTGETVNFTYHVGFDSNKSEEYSDTEKYDLTYEMTAGFKFIGEFSESINESYSQTLMLDA